MCVIDTASRTVDRLIRGLSFEPFGVDLTPDGHHAYVSHFGDSGMLVDLATGSAEVLPFPFEGAFRLAVTPDGTRGYVGRDHNDDLFATDLKTHAVTAVVPTTRNVADVIVTLDGRLVYASQSGGHGPGPNMMVIDAATARPACCPASWDNAQPRGMAVTPDGKSVYVTDSRLHKVLVVPVPDPVPDSVGNPVPDVLPDAPSGRGDR